MNKLLSIAALSLLLGLASASPALGQDPKPALDFTMTPKKLGDGSPPRSVALKGELRAKGMSESSVAGWRLLLPKGFKFNGGRFPKCSAAAMTESKSIAPCPKKSIMGIGPDRGHKKGTPTHWYVNGGAKRIWAFIAVYNPILLQEPIALNVKRLKGSKWGYELSIQLPPHFMMFAGHPIGRSYFDIALGTKKGPKYFTVGKCPKRGFLSYRMTAISAAGPTDLPGRLPCR